MLAGGAPFACRRLVRTRSFLSVCECVDGCEPGSHDLALPTRDVAQPLPRLSLPALPSAAPSCGHPHLGPPQFPSTGPRRQLIEWQAFWGLGLVHWGGWGGSHRWLRHPILPLHPAETPSRACLWPSRAGHLCTCWGWGTGFLGWPGRTWPLLPPVGASLLQRGPG